MSRKWLVLQMGIAQKKEIFIVLNLLVLASQANISVQSAHCMGIDKYPFLCLIRALHELCYSATVALIHISWLHQNLRINLNRW